MNELLTNPSVLLLLEISIISLSMVAMVLIIVLRDKISGVHVSRTGVEIRTNDVPVWSKIVDKIERIDANTCKSIRKATTGLMIIDPEQYNLSAEAMLVVREANQPLVYAAYENHHTRALAADADVYLADKTHDISEAVRIGKKHFPELTSEKSNAFACYWFKRVLLPNLRRACAEKVAYYSSQIGRSEISHTVKEILIGCLKKNEEYIQCIDKLAASTEIGERSSIFYPLQKRGEP